ncbi:MAG: hypothetical protein AB1631_15755 [Acidobacteriota bacterium]
MGEKLVSFFRVEVGGLIFENAPKPSDLGQPISLSICHRDKEKTRLTLTVKDYDLDTENPFPVYNTLPNPRTSELVPVVAYIGWEDEPIVKAFEGLYAKIRATYQPSRTEIIAIHGAMKLSKRGRVDVKKNLTLKEFITQKFAEEGITAQFHKSAAGDIALTTPIEVFIQAGTQWDEVKMWLRANGYIWNTIKKDIVVIRRDKSDGQIIRLRRGDEHIISLEPSAEQKFDEKSGRRKGHAHEPKPGQRWSRLFEFTKDTSRAVEPVTPPIGKAAKGPHKVPLHRDSVRGRAKRHEIEGDQLRVTIRFRPEMRNEERIVISDFGRRIDGEYQTVSVEHVLGGEPARTIIEAVRP